MSNLFLVNFYSMNLLRTYFFGKGLSVFGFLFFFVFLIPGVVYAAPPASYVGPTSKEECKKDLKHCAGISTACKISPGDPYTKEWTRDKKGEQTICSDWSATSWSVISDFFIPCYAQDFSQSDKVLEDDNSSKYGHANDSHLKMWDYANRWLHSDESKMTGPISMEQSCQRFFKDSKVSSVGSPLFPPVTKYDCSVRVDACADLYKKCNIADDKNEFITQKSAMCSATNDAGHFDPPDEPFGHCLDGLSDFGSSDPSAEFCAKITTHALGKKCTCGSGVISNNRDAGFQQTAGACCHECLTLTAKYGSDEIKCSTDKTLALASGKKLEFENSGKCEAVNQTFIKYKGLGGGTLDIHYCGHCNPPGQKSVSKSIQVTGESAPVMCPLADYACPDDTKPTIDESDLNANPDILLKKVCTACATNSVKIGGVGKECEKPTVLPAIKAFPDPWSGQLENDEDFVVKFIAQVIRSLLGIVGALALGLVVYGGVVWMTSAGNQTRIDAGKKTLMWALLGLVAIFISSAVVSSFFNILG